MKYYAVGTNKGLYKLDGNSLLLFNTKKSALKYSRENFDEGLVLLFEIKPKAIEAYRHGWRQEKLDTIPKKQNLKRGKK